MELSHRSEVLDLSNKNITCIEDCRQFIDDGPVLQIDLSKNKITNFDIKKLLELMPNLQTFIFSHNQITELRTSMLTDLPEDSFLDLSNNPIAKVSTEFMSLLSRLQDKRVFISLYGTRLSPKTLKALKKVLESPSKRNYLIAASLMVAGGVLGTGSTATIAISDWNRDGYHMGAESLAFGVGVLGLLVSMGLCSAKAIYSCCTHDENQSRLYWYREV